MTRTGCLKSVSCADWSAVYCKGRGGLLIFDSRSGCLFVDFGRGTAPTKTFDCGHERCLLESSRRSDGSSEGDSSGEGVSWIATSVGSVVSCASGEGERRLDLLPLRI